MINLSEVCGQAETEGIAATAFQGLSKAATAWGQAGGKTWEALQLEQADSFCYSTGIVIAAAYVAAKAFDAWRESVARAARFNMMQAAMATRSGIDKQIADLKTMDDRTRP